MSHARRFAASLLGAVVHQHHADDWAVAMLRELDAVEGDWAALRWAVGGTVALLKRDLTRHATGVLAGVAVAAGVLTACMGGLAHLAMFRAALAQWLTAIILPESVFVIAAFGLWRRWRSTAMGFALSAVLLVAHVCFYVTAGAQAPTNRPELEKLSYFIGTWRAEGEMKASMFGPAGKVTNVTQNEWILNKSFYITHHEEHNPAGTFQMVNITGYDPEKKKYVEYEFDGQGNAGRSEGTFDGTTWTWTSEFGDGTGQTIKSRGTVKPTSATSYDFTWEIAPHGTDWTLIQQGKATKS